MTETLPKHGTGRLSKQIKALLSVGLLAGFGAVSTLAAWTGGATATSEIGAGTVAIGVGSSSSSTSPSYVLPLAGVNWYPGRSEAALISVRNSGTLAAPYQVTGSVTENGTGALGAGLAVKVTTGAVTGGAGSTACGGTIVTEKAAGALSWTVSTPRPLAVGAVETLCVQYSLPTTAPTTLQGKSTSIKITFTATLGVP